MYVKLYNGILIGLTCAPFRAEENSTTYRTCEGNLDGSPPDGFTNLNLSTSFIKSAVPAKHRILLPIVLLTLSFAPDPLDRTLIWPARENERR